MKNFVEELKWRGMLAQIMPGTEEFLQKEILCTLCKATSSTPGTAHTDTI